MIKMLATGPPLFALALLSIACSAECPPVRPMTPPVVYLQEVPEPRLAGRTNADLLNWAVNMRQALRLANSDKAQLRLWLEEAGGRPSRR